MAGKHGPAPLSPTAKLVARIALLSIVAAVVVAAAGEAAGGDIHTHYRGARLRPESGGFELARGPGVKESSLGRTNDVSRRAGRCVLVTR